ncbi:MAG: hypothetical protein V1753_03765, partial [Pseudomonadota bacterium]
MEKKIGKKMKTNLGFRTMWILATMAVITFAVTISGCGGGDDDDTAGITVTPLSGLVTTEAGGTANFTVVLNTQPTSDVTIGLSSSDTTEGTVAPSSLTFAPANWNTPQTVTVTGVDDFDADGNIVYTIITAAAVSAGNTFNNDENILIAATAFNSATYNNLDASDVSVTNNNDDNTAGITVTPLSGLVTTEVGGTANFTVVLNAQPTSDVTIGLSSSDTTEGTVAPSSLTFAP